MKPHKWAKEIKAWADGAEIEYVDNDSGDYWQFTSYPNWQSVYAKFRIKPQPKEPQYCYLWKNNLHETKITTEPPHPLKEYVSVNWKCVGKIKLEVDE